MNTTNRFVGYDIWTRISSAIKSLECIRVELDGNKELHYEPEYCRLFYSGEHDLVVTEIERSQFPEDIRPEVFFNRPKAQSVLKSFVGRPVQVLEYNEMIYFRVRANQYEFRNDAKNVVRKLKPEKHHTNKTDRPMSVAG